MIVDGRVCGPPSGWRWADDVADAEVVGQAADSRGELLPPQVRLGAGGSRKGCPALSRIACTVNDGISMPVKALSGEVHHRAARPVVDQFVGAEGGDELGSGCRAGGGRRCDGVARVGEAVEGDAPAPVRCRSPGHARGGNSSSYRALESPGRQCTRLATGKPCRPPYDV